MLLIIIYRMHLLEQALVYYISCLLIAMAMSDNVSFTKLVDYIYRAISVNVIIYRAISVNVTAISVNVTIYKAISVNVTIYRAILIES